MTRILSFIIVFLLIVGGLLAWKTFGSGTAFSEKTKTFIIEEGQTSKAEVMAVLKEREILSSPAVFGFLGSSADIWSKIRPGKYEVKKGQSTWQIVRMLKNGKLAEFKLVINRVRTKPELAKLISRSFKPDSAAVMKFLQSNDSLKRFEVDTNTVFTMIIPDTYLFYWNTSLSRMFGKLFDEHKAFWRKNHRTEKAKNSGFSQKEIYTLASIVDEETNFDSDKIKIASVYINRLHKDMPLQACPTIKYAMNDFTLTRIYEKYLSNPSPYNTYRRKGLPPGPICTPMPKTIDIILDAPKTDYLFFVAKADFSGYHHFSSSYDEHSRYAKEYQKKLDEYMAAKQQNAKP
jgi:UPF0755 protein